MNEYVDKANKLEKKGIQMLNSIKFYTLLKNEKRSKALNILQKSSNYYKLGKRCDKAAKIQEIITQNISKMDDNYELSKSILETARLYKEIDPKKSLENYDKYLSINKDKNSASIYKEIAEYMASINMYDEAIDKFEDAISLYELGGYNSSKENCLDNICNILFNQNRITEVIEYFLRMVKSVSICKKSYIFAFMICATYDDMINSNMRAKELFNNNYSLIKNNCDSKEVEILEDLLEGNIINCKNYVDGIRFYRPNNHKNNLLNLLNNMENIGNVDKINVDINYLSDIDIC